MRRIIVMHASRNRIIALNIISFLGQGSLYMMNLAFVYYIRYTIGTSAFAVGAAGALYNLTYLLGCLFILPRLAGRRKSFLIITAFAGMGLSVALLMLTPETSMELIRDGGSRNVIMDIRDAAAMETTEVESAVSIDWDASVENLLSGKAELSYCLLSL